MTATDLRNLRQKIGFSMSDIAACLGVPKSTYQRYEDGSSAVPANIERAAMELQQINDEFMAGLPGRVDSAAGTRL